MRVDSAPQPYVAPAAWEDEAPGALPRTSSADGLPSLDALTRLLLTLEAQDQDLLTSQADRIESARGHLRELQQELIHDLAEALRAARQSHKKKGGWFSNTFGGAIDVVAKVIGKGAEINEDLLFVQGHLARSLYQNRSDPSALRTNITSDLLEITRGSETEQSVRGFVNGTARFAGDTLTFQVALIDALAKGAVRGDAAAELVRAQGERLYGSFEHNILENPDFWVVVERTAQAAAVAGAVSSGGALALVSLALIAAIEADNRYGYVEDLAGKKAAPWARLGMQAGLVATSATGAAGGGNNLLNLIQGATAALEGVHTVHQGVEIRRESSREANEIEANADVLETQNRMDQLQRLIDRLLETYEEQSEENDENRELSADLAEAHAASQAAVVLPA